MSRPSFHTLLFLLLSLGPCGAIAQGRGDGPPGGLVGIIPAHPSPAPDFELIDQHGAPFRLSSARGKVVVVTFIYTHCADVCPYVTMKLKAARDLLGEDASKAVFVAVTTDPWRDTPSVIAEYSREAGLFDKWHFVSGSPRAMKKVWQAYRVGVVVNRSQVQDASGAAEADGDSGHAQALSAADRDRAARIASRFGGGYEVAHIAPFRIIDPAGDIRATLDENATPADIVTDVRALLPGR